jgi:hypothetical protein
MMSEVRFVQKSLEEVARVLEAAGKKTPTRQVQAVIDLFAASDSDTIETFLNALRERLEPKPKTKSTSAKKLNTDAIDQYVQQLRAVGTNKSAFDTLFAQLSNDKNIRKDEAVGIARAYTGRAKWKSKQDAIAAIKTQFDEQAYDEVKMRQVEKASRW